MLSNLKAKESSIIKSDLYKEVLDQNAEKRKERFNELTGEKISEEPADKPEEVPDDSPDDAPLAVVEGPDDSNRSRYTPVTQTVDNVNHLQHYKHGCTAGNLRRTYS